MSELRSKVIGGTIKPITPGKYSLDLILLMQSLLQTSPSKRPSMDKILASPAVQKHMSGLAAAAPKAKGKTESQLIGTIKVSYSRFATNYGLFNSYLIPPLVTVADECEGICRFCKGLIAGRPSGYNANKQRIVYLLLLYG